jgi:hypothetical protein
MCFVDIWDLRTTIHFLCALHHKDFLFEIHLFPIYLSSSQTGNKLRTPHKAWWYPKAERILSVLPNLRQPTWHGSHSHCFAQWCTTEIWILRTVIVRNLPARIISIHLSYKMKFLDILITSFRKKKTMNWRLLQENNRRILIKTIYLKTKLWPHKSLRNV